MLLLLIIILIIRRYCLWCCHHGKARLPSIYFSDIWEIVRCSEGHTDAWYMSSLISRSGFVRRRSYRSAGKLAPIVTNTTLTVCRLFGTMSVCLSVCLCEWLCLWMCHLSIAYQSFDKFVISSVISTWYSCHWYCSCCGYLLLFSSSNCRLWQSL